MISNDVLFTGMDIPNEVKKFMDHTTSIKHNMTEEERKAYEFGVSETLRAVRIMLNIDDTIVFHLEGWDHIEEFDIDELIRFAEEKKEHCDE